MTAEDKYFQFPIAAMRLNKSIDKIDRKEMATRLHEIIDYCIIDVGTSLVSKQSDEAVVAMAYRGALSAGVVLPDTPAEYELIMYAGANQLGVMIKGQSFQRFQKNHSAISRLASQHGAQQCRLRANIVWDAITEEAWEWRDLSTLAAVYAGVGAYKRNKLTYDRIGSLALGFSGQKERDAYKAKKWQLSDRQTQWTVNRLRDRKWFVSASPNRRHVFYSHRMSLDQLIDNLAESAVERSKVSATSVTDLIKKRQAEIVAKSAAI